MNRYPTFAVEASALVKSYGEERAVDGLDLRVPAGAIYGLLGPNGAGKTTAVRILATLLQPDSGTATVLGHDSVRDPGAVRERISLTGQFASVDEDLTGLENLTLLARLLGFSRKQAASRTVDLLEAFGLEEAAGRLVKTYSGGMRRRLDIAASIIVTPDLLFLDEPTTGLDPRSRNQVWEIVRALAGQGTTVLLTTQYLDEADQLAGRIAVLDHGKVIAEGTPGELKASIGPGTLTIRLLDPARRPEAVQILTEELRDAPRSHPDPFALSAKIPEPDMATRILSALAGGGIAVTQYSLGQPSLDEVFLALTGAPAGTTDTTRENAA